MVDNKLNLIESENSLKKLPKEFKLYETEVLVYKDTDDLNTAQDSFIVYTASDSDDEAKSEAIQVVKSHLVEPNYFYDTPNGTSLV